MKKISDKDKRKHKRFNCLVPVEGKKGSPFDRTRTLDISKNGIGFISSRSISLNQKIAIEIVLDPQSEPVLVVGQVRWIQPVQGRNRFRVGMDFSEVVQGSRSRLAKYFEETMP